MASTTSSTPTPQERLLKEVQAALAAAIDRESHMESKMAEYLGRMEKAEDEREKMEKALAAIEKTLQRYIVENEDLKQRLASWGMDV